MEETKYPFVSNGLIAYLEKTFPNEYPTKEISIISTTISIIFNAFFILSPW